MSAVELKKCSCQYVNSRGLSPYPLRRRMYCSIAAIHKGLRASGSRLKRRRGRITSMAEGLMLVTFLRCHTTEGGVWGQ